MIRLILALVRLTGRAVALLVLVAVLGAAAGHVLAR